MPIPMDYLTVDEFKARVGRTASTPETDAAIGQAIASASRQVDAFCGRSFGQSDAPEARLWTASPFVPPGSCLAVGDVVAVAEIASDDGTGTYPTVWDPATYVLAPASAAWQGEPYREINPAPGVAWWPSWTTYGVAPSPVRITGTWGWPAVPPTVTEATFLIANRLKSLWSAPFGSAGSGEMGQLQMAVSLTPIVKEMIAPFRVMPL